MTQAPQHGGGRRASLDRVERALHGMGLSVRPRGSRALMAQCPVHNERTGSLSVTWSDDAQGGKVLLYCHGCQSPTAEIAEALGLTVADLFDEPLPPKYEPNGNGPAKSRAGRSYRQRKNGQRRGRLGPLPKSIAPPRHADRTAEDVEHSWHEVRTYPYFDGDGVLVQEVIREECRACEQPHKQFRQVFVVDDRRRRRKPEGFAPVLFRHPETLEAIANGTPVWLLEGEKDVETAEGLGLVAATNAQGGRSFPAELAEVFTGADVRVVLDRDEAGWDRGVFLQDLLGDLAEQVRFFLPATVEEKSDFTDHIEAGHGVDELVEVTAGEVAAWAQLSKLRKKHDAVEHALAEVSAQIRAVEDARTRPEVNGQKVDDHQRYAKRWAVESEIRCEALTELFTELQGLVQRATTEWSVAALEEGEEVVRQAFTAARATHHTLGLPIPPLLQDRATQPQEPAEPAGGGEAPGEDATARDAGAGQSSRFTPGADALLPGRQIDQPVFRIVDGQIVMVDRGGKRRRGRDDWDEEDDENLKLILGLDVRIVEMEYQEAETDDDLELPELMGRESRAEQEELNPAPPPVLSAYVISFTHPDSGETMHQRIKADDWNSGVWLDSLPGQPDYDAKPSGIALIRRAVKAVSENIRTTQRYQWTGWRRTEDGGWVFVHGGGAIGPDGFQQAPVLLSGPLAQYDLPDPTLDPAVLREAFTQASGAFMTKLPGKLAAPVLGHTYRSALGVNPWVLALIGSPGSYKTSIASLAMHHWGERWDRRRPATSMSGNGSTLNALRIQLNRAKDALFWADDVAPTKDWGLAQKNLEEFARMVHNAESRTRAERDGQGVLDGTKPRASAMVTSEVMPRPGSGADRMLVVQCRKEEIELQHLIDLDSDTSRHQRALLMAGFLQWLAGDIEQIRKRMQAEVGLYAEQLRTEGKADRIAEAVANAWAGWLMMTEFLTAVGAITVEERDAVLERVDHGLREALEATVDPDMPMRTGQRVRELLAHALRTGIAYVDDVRTGDAPEWPLAGRLGWRRTLVASDELGNHKYRMDVRGIKLGWVRTEVPQGEQCQQLYIESTAALEQVLAATAKAMTDAPQLDRGTAIRALHDEGILMAEERKSGNPRFTMQRSIPCEQRRQRVTVLRLEPLLGEEDLPDDGDPTPPEGGPAGSDGGCVGGAWDDLFPSDNDAGEQPPTGMVDDSQQSGLVSKEPTGELTTPTEPEAIVATYTDADGQTATTMVATQHAPCVVCGNRCGITLAGQHVHIPCFERTTQAQRDTAASPQRDATPAAAAPEKDAPEQLADSPVPSKAPAKKAAATPPKGRSKKAERLEAANAQFAGPTAILDADAIWMPDGTQRPRPEGLVHVGQLAELVDDLELGTQVTGRRTWPGQIWVTAAALAGFGIDAEAEEMPEDPRSRGEVLRTLTKGTAFVEEARSRGWEIGGAGDCLASWTRVWRSDSDRRGVWIVLMPGIDGADMHTTARLPLLQDNPSMGTLARRLSLFADALHAPFTMSPATTGLDLMVDLRGRDRDRMFTVVENLPEAATWSTTESDINWSRKPSAEESERAWLHAYDRGGSYAAGIAGLELPIGEPVHHPEGTAFDKKTPGYWKVEVPEAGDWRFPNPLNPSGRMPAQPVWFTTPTLELAAELEYPLEILEAYTWPDHGRVLDPWYDRIRDARTALDTDDVDAQVARTQLKAVYAFSIGMLGSDVHMKGRREYAPHRRHHIIAKARSNIMRRVLQIGRDVGVWPVAINKDTILYVSDEPDPIKAWPGSPKHLGRGFGQYKPEGSAPLADQLQFLDGVDYRGKKHLTDPSSGDGLAD